MYKKHVRLIFIFTIVVNDLPPSIFIIEADVHIVICQ